MRINGSRSRNSLLVIGLTLLLAVWGWCAYWIHIRSRPTKGATADNAAIAQHTGHTSDPDTVDRTASLDRSSPPEPTTFPQVIDVDGVLRHPGQGAPSVTTVFVFLSTHCPICNAYLPELKRLAEAYAPLNVEFYGVIADRRTSVSEAADHRRMYQLDFPVFLDTTGTFRRQLRPTHTPQAIVVDRQGAVVYSGRIDDRYAALDRARSLIARRDVEAALRATRVGRQPEVSRTEPVGCLLEPEDEKVTSQQLTFCRDIAPIVYANCVRCHRDGEASPFPLVTYEDVSRRAAQIASVLKQRIMPPWRARQGFGHFLNERRLGFDEIERFTLWTRNGAPRGDLADLPPRPQFAAGWQLGKPDLVLTMLDEFEIPADGPDIYRHFVIPTGMTEDRLASAFEFHPGNPRVVHHSWLYLDTHGEGRRLDAADPGPGYSLFSGPGFFPAGNIGGWAPGGLPRRLPTGMGRLVPANSDLVLQVHYHPTGRRERDRSTIGLYFAPKTAQCLAGEIAVATTDLDIPAGARRKRIFASHTLPVNVYLLDVTPHMHQLGREMQVKAVLPNSTVIPLIAIDDWSFYWQDHYVYREPVWLPKGTRIELEASFDNSSDNPQNPHLPPRDVHFGEMSDDEMCMCYFQVTAATFAEMQMIENDKYRYFDEMMQRYQRAKAVRNAAMAARRAHPGAALGN